MNDKIIGILGGMGPEATAHYYTQLIKRTKVKRDQDHFHVVIEANAKIPDRTQAILYGKESPLPALIEGIHRLNRLGVDQAFITCITSHYFYEDLRKEAKFELLNAIELLYQRLHQAGIRKVGLLATSGTLKTGLFHRVFKDIELVVPDPDVQETLVMDAIYNPETGIKSGHVSGAPLEELRQAADTLIAKGAQALIGGCTEISMVFGPNDFQVPFHDPMLATIDHILGRDNSTD